MVLIRILGNGVLVGWAGPAVGNPKMCNVVWRTGDVKDNALDLDPTHSGLPGPLHVQPEHLCSLQVTAVS